MPSYAALLRGINLGKRTVKMAELRQVLEEAGYAKVKTLLASGNVVLEAKASEGEPVAAALQETLRAAFGFEIPVVVRSQAQIAALVESDPFRNTAVDKDTRLYVSFLASPVREALPAALQAGDSNFRLVQVSPDTIASVVRLEPSRGTLSLMDALDKHFGSQVTTRNWNTVLKLQAALEAL